MKLFLRHAPATALMWVWQQWTGIKAVDTSNISYVYVLLVVCHIISNLLLITLMTLFRVHGPFEYVYLSNKWAMCPLLGDMGLACKLTGPSIRGLLIIVSLFTLESSISQKHANFIANFIKPQKTPGQIRPKFSPWNSLPNTVQNTFNLFFTMVYYREYSFYKNFPILTEFLLQNTQWNHLDLDVYVMYVATSIRIMMTLSQNYSYFKQLWSNYTSQIQYMYIYIP